MAGCLGRVKPKNKKKSLLFTFSTTSHEIKGPVCVVFFHIASTQFYHC